MKSHVSIGGISVIGLGKLGLCLAGCIAKSGFRTLGVDSNKRVVNAINQGRAHIFEPGLTELVAEVVAKETLSATTSYYKAIIETDVTFILVPTPTAFDGHISNEHVEAVLAALGNSLAKTSKSFHTFVVCSTVSPGSTKERFVPLLEAYSKRRNDVDFAICYSPEFVALGEVIRGFLTPDFVLIGESSPKSGRLVEQIYRQLCTNRPTFCHMSTISAEIAKISLNAYMTVKISFANTLSRICEAIPGAELDAITAAIGRDRRVSSGFFRGGTSYGGPCFPRDTAAFSSFAERFGNDAALVRAAAHVNESQDRHLADVVSRAADNIGSRRVGILGLSFKPNTSVIKESAAVKLIPELLSQQFAITVFDPLARRKARKIFGNSIQYANCAEQCLKSAPLCILATSSPSWITAVERSHAKRLQVIVDCWRILDGKRLPDNIRLIALGMSSS